MPGSRQRILLFNFMLWMFAAAAALTGSGSFERQLQPGRQFWNVYSAGEPVLRLHVIANSDTPEDQAYKEQVVRIVRRELDHQGAFISAEACRDYVGQAIPSLENEIRNSLPEPVPGQGVSMEIGRSFFPLRAYGNQVLPPGQYLALKIIIGAGKGENWWCLLFPPLCTTLTECGPEEEPAAGTDGKDQKPDRQDEPVRRRFQVWEWLKQWLRPKQITDSLPLPGD